MLLARSFLVPLLTIRASVYTAVWVTEVCWITRHNGHKKSLLCTHAPDDHVNVEHMLNLAKYAVPSNVVSDHFASKEVVTFSSDFTCKPSHRNVTAALGRTQGDD